MEVQVILFGRLTDITNAGAVKLSNVQDTDEALLVLKEQYPALADKPFIMAVNEQIINGNTLLSDNCTIALLPPYSGG